MIVADYERYGIDPRCDCNGQGGQDHNFEVRCGVCSICGERIKGVWFYEHEGQCWAKQQEESAKCQTVGSE